MRALALATLLALAACGQKGNLYLPDEGIDPVTSVRTIPADAAATEEPDGEKKPRGN